MIAIVDYGMGNLGSIQNMFRRIGVPARLVSDPAALRESPKVVLPGVGAFDAAMERIAAAGLRPVLDELALERRVPVLGICLGMQLLTRSSEEGRLPGLGWIAGETRRFPRVAGLPVPHMGWNVARSTCESRLTAGLGEEPRFYFVHSYYVQVDEPEDSVLKTVYGLQFDSAVSHGNIYGAQFHPEKSHKYGMQLLRNFAAL